MTKKSNPFNPFGDDASKAQFNESVRASAQQIWLAGLGAFAKAQAEGGKVFDTLVKEGTGMQRKTQAAAEERFGDTASRVGSMASEFGARAAGQWDKLENIFEERVAKALRKLGVPTVAELEELRARIDVLERNAEAPAAARAATPRKRPGRKTAGQAVHASSTAAPQPATAKRAARKRSTPRGG